MTEMLLSLEEAAKQLGEGYTPTSLRMRLNKGTLPGVKVAKGKRQVWAIKASTIESLLSEASSGLAYQKLVKQ